jgi:gliding motility-associated-like protein
MFRIWITLFFFLSALQSAFGFHIAGGDLTVEHLGNQNFRVKLSLFRDCSNSQGAGFDNTIILGIYKRSNNQLFDSLHMNLSSVNSIGLTGNSCVPPPNVCMEIGDYIRDVNLPAQPGGYYLVWERCCRNSDVINISNPDNAGMAFYVEIPDPALQNSTPVFNSAPTPFSCAGQLFRFPFEASDADGDSLMYQFSTPLDGGHTWNQNPNPFSPGGQNIPPDPAPYAEINWSPPFSIFNLTDGAIPVTLDPQTGLMEGSADIIGLYAIAVTVYEYRNGVLIGSVRREIEFTVIPCNNNTVPIVTNTINSVDTTIFAGDTLCFFIRVNDPDGDTLTITHSGELFQNDPKLSISPPYAQSSDSIGIASILLPFCWYTSCNQSRDSAYIIQYEATDNGCPIPATQRVRISITVKPVPVAPAPNLLCMRLLNDDILELHMAANTTLPQRYLRQYNIYRSINGDAMQLYRTLSDYNLQIFTDSNAIDNNINDYCYAVSIVNSCGAESGWSDTLCSSTSGNFNTNYLKTVTVDGNKEIRIVWEEYPDGPFSTYHLYRRNNEAGTLPAEIATLQNYYPMQYIDRTVKVSEASYCYTLVNEDVCGNFSPVSDEACTIHLQGSSEIFLHRLSWNEFRNWRGGTDFYETQRNNVGETSAFELLKKTNVLTLEDREIPVSGGSYAYRIRAVEGSGSYNEESFSNEIILQQQPMAWIPNAFSPNNDGKNDQWGVETSFVENIELQLFNRWGQEVWRTSDKTSRWDGKYSGTEAPQGIYFYRLTYKGYTNDQRLEKTGRVTLLR